MNVRVAAYAIVTGGRGLLLAHWRQGDRSGWTPPGGGLEPGEHPADTVLREVEEETGYRTEIAELLGIDSVVAPDGSGTPTHGLRIVYRARIIGGELRAELNGSTDRAAWFPTDEVDALDRVPLVDAGRRLAGLL